VTAAADDRVDHRAEIDGLRAAGMVVNRLRIFVALPA